MADQEPSRPPTTSIRRRQTRSTGSHPARTGTARHRAPVPAPDPDLDEETTARRISPAALIALGSIGLAILLLLWLMFGQTAAPVIRPVAAPPPPPRAAPTDPIPTAVGGNRPPTAVIRTRPDPEDALRIEYSALFSEDPDPGDEDRLAFHWDFGDGTTATAAEGEHRFPRIASYPVTLAAMDPQGGRTTATVTIDLAFAARLTGRARTVEVPGLVCRRMKAEIRSFARLESRIPKAETITAQDIDLVLRPSNTNYAFRFDGYLAIPADGAWEFTLTSDDGSRLVLGEKTVVSMDRDQPARSATTVVECTAGLVPLRVDYFQGLSDQELRLEWSGPGQERQRVPASAYFRDP